MPHFIIDCSPGILEETTPDELMLEVHNCALNSGLFATEGSGGIKVRIRPYAHYLTVGSQDDFIHVFGNIMEGRTDDQKKQLSQSIVARLKQLHPNVEVISMNIREFEKSSYSNRSMI